MRQIKLVFFSSVFLVINLLVNVCYAIPSDDLSNTLTRIHAMKANFVQTTFDNRGKAVQHAKGALAWVRPGKFRWETKQPIPQLIIANGERLWIVDPDLMQVTIRKAQKELGETPTMLLSANVVQLEQQFAVSVTKQQAGLLVYTLQPKKKDSTFLLIQLSFRNNHIVGMQLEDQLGHRTQIEFSQVLENPTLSAGLFQYVPKPGMDVINEVHE